MTYIVQIDDEIREATAAEVAVIEAEHEESAARLVAFESAIAAKLSARRKLAALGLTDAEIAALVG